MNVSIGLWGMQAPWSRPTSVGQRMNQLWEASALAEQLGFRGIWLSEHRLWYDGYDSTPLQTAMRILARTNRLRVGTSVVLLPQHNPTSIADRSAQVAVLSGGRLDLGVGLGYRNIEFDALGIERRHRGRRMDQGLIALEERWRKKKPKHSPAVLVGAASKPAIQRAARYRAGLVLPGGFAPGLVRASLETYRAASSGESPPETTLIRHVWVADSEREAQTAIDALVRLFTDQYGGMSELEDSSVPHPGVIDPLRELTVGPPDRIIEMIESYRAVGVDHVIARVHNPYLPAEAVLEAIQALAERVVAEVVT